MHENRFELIMGEFEGLLVKSLLDTLPYEII
jgi:hypothetical protein